MISASHNPFEDNGIKVFSGRGEKFTERVEREVEAIVADPSWQARSGEAVPLPTASLVAPYLDHLRAVIDDPDTCGASGWRSIARTAPPRPSRRICSDRWASTTIVIGDHPDGRNINLRSGSTHPERLAQVVVEKNCAMGVAFDGDGDRAIFVDAAGQIVNGDAVLLMCARQLQREGRLKGNAIVATVMSNLGLQVALAESGIGIVRCPVGDKYVMEEMLARGLSLGGEQSGHIIFSDYLFTGDGLCTALNVLRTVALSGRTLADLAKDLVTFPQILLNVRVREKVDLAAVPAVADAIARVEQRLDSEGRLARPLLGHRTASARDARRPGRARGSHLGAGDRRRRQEGAGLRKSEVAKSDSLMPDSDPHFRLHTSALQPSYDPPLRQRQQDRDHPEFPGRSGAARPGRRAGLRGCRRARDHRAPARRSPAHHAG